MMSQTVLMQLGLWLAYVVAGYRFFAFVSRHAIALYCTREVGNNGNRIRVFIQNLEDEALIGAFRLRISVDPKEPTPQQLVVRAGPKTIKQDRSLVDRGVWCASFARLPALDTWLFEVEVSDERTKVVVEVESVPVSVQSEDDSGTSRTIVGYLNLIVRRARARLPRLATNQVTLDVDQSAEIAGAHATPRYGTLSWVMILALGGQWLITWAALSAHACPQIAALSGLDPINCSLSGTAFPTSVDVILSIALAAAILFCFWAGRRNPTPIAQGYLERSVVKG